MLLEGDVGDESFCRAAVETTIEEFGRLDILVNNAAEQHETDDIRDIAIATATSPVFSAKNTAANTVSGPISRPTESAPDVTASAPASHRNTCAAHHIASGGAVRL